MSVRTPLTRGGGAAPLGAIGAVLAALVGPVLATTLARAVHHLPLTLAPMPRLAVGTTLYGLGLTTAGVAYLVLTGRLDRLRPAGFDRRRSRLVVVGTATLVVLWLVAVTGLSLLGFPFAGNATTSMADRGFRASLLVLAVLSPLVIAPTEELLYRGVLQDSLYDVASRPVAILLASVPFTLVHVPTLRADTTDPTAVAVSLVAVFGLSIAFGWLYARTDDLLVPVAVHGSYNLFVFGLLYAGVA